MLFYIHFTPSGFILDTDLMLYSFHAFGIFLQSRRDGMIIEKQMIKGEPRRGEMIIVFN
jgi:hypothetical protein